MRLVSLKSSTPFFADAPCSSHLAHTGEQDGYVASVSNDGMEENDVEEWSAQTRSETRFYRPATSFKPSLLYLCTESNEINHIVQRGNSVEH